MLVAWAFLIASALVALFITVPLSIRVAGHIGGIDNPGELKVHSTPISRLGGLGILLAYLPLFFLSVYLSRVHITFHVAAALVSTLLISAIGFVDDLRGLPQTVKFLLETAVAIGLVWVFWKEIPNVWWAGLAAIWLVGLLNAYNFIDGLDGLSGGMFSINFVALGIMGLLAGLGDFALLALIVAGALLGFLRHNWQPARVFMGDGGALGLGYLAAGLSLVYVVSVPSPTAWISMVMLAALPIADVVFTLIRRLITLRTLTPWRLFSGDRHHYYDQLRSNAGFSVKKAVFFSYAAATLMALVGLGIQFLSGIFVYVIGVAAFAVLILMARHYQIGIE